VCIAVCIPPVVVSMAFDPFDAALSRGCMPDVMRAVVACLASAPDVFFDSI
jgi:hypothetical protein